MIATVTSPPCDPGTQNPVNEAAIKILGRPYLSWSAVSTFAQCPLKFRFRYVDRLPEESVSASLVCERRLKSAARGGRKVQR